MDKMKRNYILNTVFQVLRLLTPLVVTPYISRVLGVDGVGIFSYTYSIQYYFSIFAVLGATGYGAREIARSRDSGEETSRLFWEIELMVVCTSLLSISVWTVFVIMSGEYQFYYTILSLYIVAAMLDVSWFFTGLERFPEIVLKNIAVRLLEVALVFLLIKRAEDLYLYFIIMAGGTFFGNVSLWFSLPKHLCKVKLSSLKVFRHFKGTLVYFLPTIATSIYTVLDKTLIGAITKDTAENGSYEQTTKIIDIAKAVCFVSLNTVIGPRSTYLFAHKEFDKVKSTLKTSLEFSMLLSIGMACGIAGVSNIFVPWFFGDGFEMVAVLLKFMAPIIVIISISNALGYQYYDPAGLRLKSAKYLIVGAVCNLILNCLLIPYFKSAGAVVGSVVSELVITILYLKNCDGYLYLTDVLKMTWKKLIAGGVMLFGLIFVSNYLKPVFTHVVLSVAAGIVVYFLLLLLLRDNILFTFLKQGKEKVKGVLKRS